MTTEAAKNQTRSAKWGWGILIVVSALLLLNGVGWFFFGPSSSASNQAQELGMTTSEYRESYPTAAKLVEGNARQVAIWYMAYGLMALIVALEGYRHGSRWAWYAMWTLVAVCAAVALLELGGIFGYIMLVLAVISLVGQLLARRNLSLQTSSAV